MYGKLGEVMRRQAELCKEESMTVRSFVCLKDDESVIDYLTGEQVDMLWLKYEDPLGLIDVADNSIKSREDQTLIRKPYKYILAIAEKQCWPIKTRR